ncbi:TetR/AcrR family transcriptional regulator [Nocardioides acrostichi]|uniref:TetR/AcrR family transcriptional regulator n=1 Tax=Nocardioides acrostichi TaxID=2784339 RepID=A0A930Y4N5_9ACTN|nr:TetR/AcrR family transcriptional regulator [Nocardioides acrostichi]MBF4160385.1 TetR/AcrR family transcriptional regulator [Nocardioides acrostichi]
MSDRPLLPLAGEPPRERADAARNRDALLCAARRLVAERGAADVTTEAVAEAAGVGKGTVFRRFGSREGLMAALLDTSEAAWQGEVLGGPPPLGPGAPPWERLEALGRTLVAKRLLHADLLRAAGRSGARSLAAYSFTAMHVQHLLRELEVEGDLLFLTTALLAPLEIPVLDALVHHDRDIPRVADGWVDLARRITRRPFPGDPSPTYS